MEIRIESNIDGFCAENCDRIYEVMQRSLQLSAVHTGVLIGTSFWEIKGTGKGDCGPNVIVYWKNFRSHPNFDDFEEIELLM